MKTPGEGDEREGVREEKKHGQHTGFWNEQENNLQPEGASKGS